VTDRVALEIDHLSVPEQFEQRVTGSMRFTVGVTAEDTGKERHTTGIKLALEDVSLTIHCGEVVGIAGVEGNGQTELVHALMGLIKPVAGTVSMFGDDITQATTGERRHLGVGYIPEDRQKEGMVLAFPLWENCVLGHQREDPYGDGIWIKREGAIARTEQIVREFDVRTPSTQVPAITLSGGNQQKMIVGREMTAGPKVLIASHPTRGIDVGAQAAIWDVIRKARALGLGVLLVSADLEELIGLSDTLHVMFRGRIAATLDPATVTPQVLGQYMTGASQGAPA
jgi:simple sugar transport system ATP-binding protein